MQGDVDNIKVYRGNCWATFDTFEPQAQYVLAKITMKQEEESATMVVVRQEQEDRDKAFVVVRGAAMAGRLFHDKWPERARLVDDAGVVGQRMECVLKRSKDRPKSVLSSMVKQVSERLVSESVQIGLAPLW